MDIISSKHQQTSSYTGSVSTQELLEIPYNKSFVWGNIITGSIGFAALGYINAVSNSVLSYLKKFLFTGLSENQLSLLVSLPLAASAIGAVSSGAQAARFGRRKVLLFWDIIGLIGVALTIFDNYYTIVSGRTLEGLFAGVNLAMGPVYLVESSPIKFRGIAGTFSVLMLTLFVTVAIAFGFIVPKEMSPGETSDAWKICYGFLAVPIILRLFAFLFIYRSETPFFLVK